MRREPPAASGAALGPLAILIFVALALVLLLAALEGSRPLLHDDLFLHLATGRLVVEQRRVPTTDPFSFTRGGERWVSHEWGFGLLTYAVWASAGFPGLVAFKALLVVAILLLLFVLAIRSTDRQRAPPAVLAVPLLTIALWAIDAQLILRASLVSALLLLLLMHLLRRFDRTGSRACTSAIVLLFLIWGNLHGEVIFGLFVLGLVTVESLLARRAADGGKISPGLLRVDPRRRYLPLFLGCFALTLVNPSGPGVLLYPFRLARFLLAGPVPLEMGHFTAATPASMPAFFLLLAALLWGLVPLRRAALLSLTELVSVGAFLLLALVSHRFIVYFTLLALPVIVRLHGAGDTDHDRLASRRWLPAALLGLTLLLVGAATAAAWRGHPGRAISRHFPAGAVRYLAREGIAGRAFHHQNYGGYLNWWLRSAVFWDGRNLLFAPLMEEVADTPLAQVAERWQIDYLLLTEFEYSRLRDQLSPAAWGLVSWDDFAALYLARRPRFSGVLERSELRQVPPFGGIEGLEAVAQDPTAVAAWRRELERVLGLEPECQRAMYLQGLLSYYQGDDERAESELRSALRPEPNGFIYRALARVLERQGRLDEARRARIRAVELGAD